MSLALRTLTLLAAPLLVAARPIVEPKPYVVDKAHSEINFIADSRLLSAHGYFEKWDATIQLDTANLAASGVSITIEAGSINTRVTMRDNHLKSDAFFDVAKFPTITFKSVGIKQSAPKIYEITGDLTMRGVTKRISVPAYMVFYDKGAGRFRGQFTVLRKEYGVSFDPPVNPIENEVQVQWDFSIKEPPPAK
ncbi:MAG: YceI family protein [Gemmatimonadaceae bacterium]|nr:YceI family protein [Gemmatimonadaceae bacterium]